MIIIGVTVTVHEKRAHPHAMGHKDCEVTFTALLQPGDNETFATSDLRQRANAHVQAELDGWIEGIKEEQRLSALRFDLEQKLRSVRYASPDRLEEARLDAITTIKMLPAIEQSEAYLRLAVDVGKAMTPKVVNDSDAEAEVPF